MQISEKNGYKKGTKEKKIQMGVEWEKNIMKEKQIREIVMTNKKCQNKFPIHVINIYAMRSKRFWG